MSLKDGKLFSGVLMLALTVWSGASFAETEYQVLVVGYQGNVSICNIDENGAWSLDRDLVTKSASGPAYQPMHAIYKNGVVYVSDMKSSGTSASFVHKYKLDGTYLGKIDIPGSAEGLAVTPDGKTLFVGEFSGADDLVEGNTYGRVFKVDVATETVEVFCYLNEGKTSENYNFRDLEIDDAGHLFVADRKGKLHIFNYTAAESANVPISKAFAFCEGVAYNSADGKVYVAGNDLKWGEFDHDDQTTTAITLKTAEKTSATKSGWCVGATVINGVIYFASYSQVGILKLDPTANEGNGEFTKVYPTSGSIGRFSGLAPLVRDDYVWTKWAFDEPNGMCSTTNDLGGGSLNYYDDVRMSLSGVKGSCAILATEASRITSDSSTSDLIPATGDFALFFWVGGLNDLASGSSVKILSNATGEAGDFSFVVNNPGTDNTLGLEFSPADGSSAVSLASAASLGDTAWHYVGAVRRGTALELWMDGVRVASATVDADKAVATGRTWTFSGCAGTAFDELEVTSDVPLKSQLIAKYQAFSQPAALPSIPALPAAKAMPSELGTQIAHAYANTAEIAMPSLLVDGETYYVTVETRNSRYDANAKTVVMKSVDHGETWTQHSELAAQSASLFIQDETLCLVGLSAGSGRMINVWTYDALLGWQAAVTFAADYDCRILPAPALIFNAGGKTDDMLSVAVAYLNEGTTLTPAVWRVKVSGHTFTDPVLTVQSNGGFVSSSYTDSYTTQADVLGVTVVSIGSNILLMSAVVDRHSVCPSLPFGPERAAYQNFLFGGGTWSTYRYNQFRGGSKPFNIRYDKTARQTYAVTVPSTSMSEIASADPETVVGKLALYVSPDIDEMAWYPCGTLLSSDTFGFLAPTFAFDGDDLIVVMAVSAPDGCGTRGRTSANYLAFKRFANFRTAYPVQTPAKSNRSRAYIATNKQIYKYYQTDDGEWQPDGCFLQDLSQAKWSFGGVNYTLADARKIVVRGKRIFIAAQSKPAHFFELNLEGSVVNGWVEPTLSSMIPLGFDVASDCSYALVSLGSAGVYKVNLSDNTWTQIVAAGDSTLTTAYDVAILPHSSDFFVSDNGKNTDRVVSRFDSTGTLRETSIGLGKYLTGLAVSASGEDLYVGDTYGSVNELSVANLSTSQILRGKISTESWLHSDFLTVAFDTLFVAGRGGSTWAYDLKTGAVTAPFAQVYKHVGLGFYTAQKISFLLILR